MDTAVMSGHDVKKLPKWAQEEIQRLESNVASLERKVRTFAGAPSLVKIAYSDPVFCLPERSAISFRDGSGEIHVGFDNDMRLIARSTTGKLGIHPDASNTARLITFR